MPTQYTDDFDRSASIERTRTSLQHNIDMQLSAITGTPDDAIPAQKKVRNFHTLDTELDEALGLTERLESILSSIDNNFPELDEEDRLFLKRDTLDLFSRLPYFVTSAEEPITTLDSIFNDGLHSTFTRHANQYHAVLAINPGSHGSVNKVGEKSEHTQELRDNIASLCKNTQKQT